MRTKLAKDLGIEFPIFAFSHCRDVVAAVSRAGGMGILGALGSTPDQLEIELDWLDRHVGGKPYGVDIVLPAKSVEDSRPDPGDLAAMIPQGHRDFVSALLTRHGVTPPEPDRANRPMSKEQERLLVDIVLAHPARILVNALGPMPPDIVERCHDHDVLTGALVGSPQHAERQRANGVDVLVAQGTEAAGHTGDVTTMVLVPQVVEAVWPSPVLAAGGIATGRQVAAALALGAQGVWTGSMWLTVQESSTPPVLKEKILAATSSDTVRTAP